MFEKPASGWASGTQRAELTASDGDEPHSFGFSVALSENTIVVGSPASIGAGSLYLFGMPSSGWENAAQPRAYPSSAGDGADIGWSVALSEGTIVGGEPLHDSKQGTVFVFASEAATFTTAAAASTVGGSGSSITKTETPPSGASVTPKPSAALACGAAEVVLINVVPHGSRVLITGAARLVLAGRAVSIKLLGTGRTVARTKIAADGTFSASAPLPPASIRPTNLARYRATVGSLSSQALKLDRRMYMLSARRSGAHVLLSGYVTGSFRPGTPVRISLRVTCTSTRTVATVKLMRSGAFRATVPAPSGAASAIAVYRAATSVLVDGHPQSTFTLPTPPTG